MVQRSDISYKTKINKYFKKGKPAASFDNIKERDEMNGRY